MHFSTNQWVAVALLDVFIRAAFFTALNSHPLYTIFTIPQSLLNIAILISIDSYIKTFPQLAYPRCILLASSNFFFLLVYLFLRVRSIKSGMQTLCVGYEGTCLWINGAITWYGFQALAIQSAIQVAINIVPVLIVNACRTERSSDPTG